ncbi:cell adhesion molecule Dscam2-like isoform X2 [Saccostrea cucullata]|uniref:cell adhesion molecule Dscam2-like isoform X2 n=1 Tax=Saccostrea cuccullata TaxID=36930 RepID=UPI002ED188BC
MSQYKSFSWMILEQGRLIINKMPRMLEIVFFSFICVGCSGNFVYTEPGEDICFTFSLVETQGVQYISRNGLIICFYLSNSVYRNTGGWINRTFNCNTTSERISICINDTQEEDAGHFSYRIGITDYRENFTLAIAESTDINVRCVYIAGKPPEAKVFWSRISDLSFRQEGGTLKLTDIKRNMSDTYTCTAENTYYSGKKGRDSQSMKVNVLYPPYVLLMENLTLVQEGSKMKITCNFTPGNPIDTEVFWTRSLDSFRENGTTLTLTDVQRNSADNYTCTAENTYPSGAKGRHSQTVSIQVLYPPVNEPIKDVFPVEGTDLTVECKFIHGNPIQTAVYWTRSQSGIFRQNGTTLSLPSIQRNASDTYTCTVENNYPPGYRGNHSQSFRIKVQYVPDLHISPGKILTAMAGQTVVMRCYVDDPELTLSYTWRKDGNSSVISVNSFIVFEQIVTSDEGNYTCTVSNRAGNNSVLASVSVQFTPLEPTQVMVVCGDIYADIMWTFTSVSSNNQSSLVQFSPKSSFVNTTQGFQDTTKAGLFASRVGNLEPSTTYEFRILTINKHGTTYSRIFFCMTRSASSTKSEATILGGTLGAFLAIAIVTVLVLIAILMKRKFSGDQKEETSRQGRDYEMQTVQKLEEHSYQGFDTICTGSTEVSNSAEYCEVVQASSQEELGVTSRAAEKEGNTDTYENF